MRQDGSSGRGIYQVLHEETEAAKGREKVGGCMQPSFRDPILEAAFQMDWQDRIAAWGTVVALTLGFVSLVPPAVSLLQGKEHGGIRWYVLLAWVLVSCLSVTWWLLLRNLQQSVGRHYASVALVYSVMAVVLSCFMDEHTGMTQTRTFLLASGILAASAQFMNMSSGYHLLLLHFVVFGELARACYVDMMTRNHAGNIACLYVYGLLCFVGLRRQEILDRSNFVAGRCGPAGDQQQDGDSTVVQVGKPNAEQKKEVKQVEAPKPKSEDARPKTVPPPPARPEEQQHRAASLAKGKAVPNAVLVRAMQGRTADWKKIRNMATVIRNPSYSLKQFFEDCVNSFPELWLFFEGSGGRPVRDGKPGNGVQTSSGLAAEAEYQRTVGALFTVYWMLRLDVDGCIGFCYGAHPDWTPTRKDETLSADQVPKDTPFSKMASMEKRASFMNSMDWNQFEDLVHRAGCSVDALHGTKRVMALLCLTAFHDIMKLPALQPIVQPGHAPYHGFEAGVRIHDHDLALSYVLEHFPNLLPSYAGLDLPERRALLFTQGKMQFNHGWFVQAEAPPGGMLSKFKSVLEGGAEQADIDLYFLHWVTDLAGAEATPLGGAEKLVLKFPHHVLASFLWSIPFLRSLTSMTETALVEEYLEARWAAMLPNDPVPSDWTCIACMRLALMAQAEDTHMVVDAFRSLPAVDQSCLVTELSRTGCVNQTFKRHYVMGGPAFLIYYSPALLQRNNKSKESLGKALRTLCVVLRGARAIWPMSLKNQGSTVVIPIGELQTQAIDQIVRDPGGEFRSVWIILRSNDLEGTVTLCKAGDLNALLMEGSRFRALDFTITQPKETKPLENGASMNPILEPMETRENDFSRLIFKHGRRILVFTDMSTECDDECALLWLVAALNRRGDPVTVELVHTDTYVRLQWMAHILADKFVPGGEWQLLDGGSSFTAGNVLVRMYLAQSTPEQEEKVIKDIERKAPGLSVATIKTADGKRVGIRKPGSVAGEDYTNVPEGPLDNIVIAAPITGVTPSFFERFTNCKCTYVVGTPGGVNCPMPSWVDKLAALHQLSHVIYLTPALTRTIRFPRKYVLENVIWPETIKRTVWDATVTFMARRPENINNWGLTLRLNVANSMFCSDWYDDVTKSKVEDAPKPAHVVKACWAYVDRHSAWNIPMGTVLEELANVGVKLNLPKADMEDGKPKTQKAKEAVRDAFRKELYKVTYTCLITTEMLLFQNKDNQRIGVDDGGFEKMQVRCGYRDPLTDLSDIFGSNDAIQLVQALPLRRLTPAYDVVGMICADSALDEGTGLDGGMGLMLEPADSTMGLALLSKEARESSNHRVLMTLPQSTGAGVYAVGPFG
eukprot:TRINITY_DN48127_c0_g1_i1.p1 TRINITY_DN48127_c0_g1~~TRINITY_DN48127_c0_g1_i1.p1  ORF type:complete len:1349 (-),score=231.37 TRINITY_DN48127_c0_g1_i1:29-4075(-)